MKTSPPQVQQYLDARAYLLDVYSWRKRQDPRFSYSVWAEEFGFKSRSFLRLLITGKRSITEGSIPVLAQGLRLNASESEYFETLIRFTQAQTIEQRERLGRVLAKSSLATESLREIQNHFRFVSRPLIPRLQTLLSVRDAAHTVSALAETLQVSVPEVREALGTLQGLGLASEDPGSSEWSSETGRFEIKEELGSLGLQAFYRKSFEETARAIELPVQERNFQCAMFPLTPEEYQGFVSELNEFLKQSLARYGTDTGEGRRLYQTTLGLIPVSRPILRPERSRGAPVGSVQPSNAFSKAEVSCHE